MTRIDVMGLPVDALTMDETVERVFDLIDSGPGPYQHVVLNAAKVVEAHRDEQLRAIIADCDIINADGMSVVWAGRALGQPIPERVAGIDLMHRLAAEAAGRDSSIFLLGARPEVVERVR